MATIYSSNYAAQFVTVPSSPAGIGEQNGRVRSAFATYTFLAESTSGDILKLFKLPKGARVVNWNVKVADMGGTGTMDIGWAASSDAVEAANSVGFHSAMDVSGQAALSVPSAGIAGLHKKFAAEVDVQIVLPTSASATGDVLSAAVQYVID